MPRSSALCTTRRVASRSIRPPKLLQPSPTADTRSPDLPRLRCSTKQFPLALSPGHYRASPERESSEGLAKAETSSSHRGGYPRVPPEFVYVPAHYSSFSNFACDGETHSWVSPVLDTRT